MPTTTTGPTTTSAGRTHGRFTGKVTIGDVVYYGDAIVTADGQIRLYVADGFVDSGVLQTGRPDSSAQLVGTIHIQNSELVGMGVVIGEHCTSAEPNRFCRDAASAEIRAVQINGAGQLVGEIRVSTGQTEESWRMELRAWVNYALSASMSGLAGLWDEQLAQFARDGDTIVRIDGMGRLFFQSAHSGCTGNGQLVAHPDGTSTVFDVSLNIGGCSTGDAALNGDFKGLASTTAGTVWDYDDVLRIWLSREGEPRVATTMLAYKRY